jgi:hypothetical protein
MELKQLSEKQTELWEAFLDAWKHRNNAYAVSYLFSYSSFEAFTFDHPVSEALSSLLKRTKEVSDAFDQFEEETDRAYQLAAWQYATDTFNLRQGDQIQIVRDGKPLMIFCDRLRSDEGELSDFWVSGPIARKDGSPGKNDYSIPLTQVDWKIVPKAL